MGKSNSVADQVVFNVLHKDTDTAQTFYDNSSSLQSRFFSPLTLKNAKTIVFTIALVHHLSYGIASGSEIMPCNKIDKPLVVYRFTGNFMTSITTLPT